MNSTHQQEGKTSNQIQKDQEEKTVVFDRDEKEWMNDLGIREIRKEEIDIDYRRKCEDKIYELKDKFNGLSIEIRKITQEAKELRKSEASSKFRRISFIDVDDDFGILCERAINTTPEETEDEFVLRPCPNPRESEGSFRQWKPVWDEFNSFSNPLYDIDDEIITNESNFLSKKDLDEIILIPPGIDEPCFNAESDLLESLLNRYSPIDSTKTDSIFDEFSFPRLPEEHNSENVDTIIESLSYSPIPVEDSDSLIEEIDLFLTSDDSMPPGIESDDYDSEGDFRFLDELLINDSLPLPENESYNLDSFDNPESPVVKSCFDFEPVAAVANDFDVLNNDESFDSGEGENVDSLNVEEEDSFTFTIRSFLPFVTYLEVLPASYSTGSEDKVFKPVC
ncbi:hypothetical protein Tco_0173745 [Tanacetum coccineum]